MSRYPMAAGIYLVISSMFTLAAPCSYAAVAAPQDNASPTPNAPTPIKQKSDKSSAVEATGIPILDPTDLQPLIAPGDPVLQPGYADFLPPETNIELVDFRDQELGDAMRLFSEQSGINIVPSTQANEMKINLFLRNVRPMDVLENLTKTHDLYFRVDEKSGVIRIFTTKEYEQNLASFREEQTKVFTLLYPNPVDAAVAIQSLFGDRVELNFGVGDQDSILDIIYRLNRFDLVDSRSLGLGSYQGDYAYGGRSFSRLDGLGGFTSNQSNKSSSNNRASNESEPLSDLSSEQIQQLIEALNERTQRRPSGSNDGNDPISRLLKERQATIYVTVVRRNNQVVVRTGDDATMKQIEQLIQNLDVPTPLVLLEVKVMSVLLDDDFRSVFDYQFSNGSSVAGGFTTGDILPPPSDLAVGDDKRLESMTPGGSLLNQGDFTFQFVNNSFRARMQLLEDDNRVTILNTPLLLTANNEVSRIFIGDTIPFTVGFNSPQVISGGNNNTTIAGTPITELRDVGQSLLITPSINADRTVTLRIVQENARRVINGGRIPILSTTGVITNQEVDTVNRSTVSGTVVAKDGLAVALGGLIEDEVSDSRSQVPGIGKLPVLGFFFRKQTTGRLRRELIVMVRPYVFNTPAESASISQDLLQQLSVHPSAMTGQSSLHTFGPHEAAQVQLDECGLHSSFRFHNVTPRNY
ncbi:type II secretion system protein GspD [Mariniblastus fucicola]|nr:secretin N-terminal domain-containing protein [Mariniblastus fucicola]